MTLRAIRTLGAGSGRQCPAWRRRWHMGQQKRRISSRCPTGPASGRCRAAPIFDSAYGRAEGRTVGRRERAGASPVYAGVREDLPRQHQEDRRGPSARSREYVRHAAWISESDESSGRVRVRRRPEQTWIIGENGPNIIRVYTDGRKHPDADDLWPTYSGDSVGHWEGDTLVFDTISTKGWLDRQRRDRRQNRPRAEREAPRRHADAQNQREHHRSADDARGRESAQSAVEGHQAVSKSTGGHPRV